MFRQHWGDLPVILDTESGIAALEREQITKPRALEIEGAKLHQLSQPVKTEIENVFNIDPLTQDTIQLLDHNRKLRVLIQNHHEQASSEGMPRTGDMDTDGLLMGPGHVPLLTPRPETPAGLITDRATKHPYNIDGVSGFVAGRGISPPELPFQIVHQVLRKAVAVICAHAGYESSSELVLDTFTSVAHQFFYKMCSMLRVAVDREALTGSTGFVDPMEEVFHKMGLGSVTTLHHFYQSRMIGYHRHLLQTCSQLEAEYQQLSSPKVHRQIQDIKVHRLSIEDPTSCEIKFPLLEESEGMNVVSSTGVAVGGTGVGSGGCQMSVSQGGGGGGGGGEQSPPPLEELHGALQGMEGTTSLKEETIKWLPPQVALRGKETNDNTQSSLDPDEIINVSDTPDPASGSEMEQMPPSVNCDPLTLSPASDTMVQFCKPPKKNN